MPLARLAVPFSVTSNQDCRVSARRQPPKCFRRKKSKWVITNRNKDNVINITVNIKEHLFIFNDVHVSYANIFQLYFSKCINYISFV